MAEPLGDRGAWMEGVAIVDTAPGGGPPTPPGAGHVLGRRRPSGEPPPLPRPISASTRVYLVATALAVALWIGFAFDPVVRAVTALDIALLRAIEELRVEPVTSVVEALDVLASTWLVRIVAWVTLVVLVASRRFQHLVAWLLVVLVSTTLGIIVTPAVGRMRPGGVEILGGWEGYAHPSEPIVALGVTLVAALYTLVPAGRQRYRAAWVTAALLALLAASRVYLAVDHPTDVAAALVIGGAVPIVGFRLLVPDEAFPVTYRRGTRAHLDVSGARGQAAVAAARAQLDLPVVAVEAFALSGSAGSTPLRLTVATPDGAGTYPLFGKLYATVHLRSDRWYKLARTVLYGRLEDERPFNAVRRLVEHEDHMLRIMRDAGLPTPAPYGFVEITPEREYLIVTEFLEDAVDLDGVEVDEALVDDALALVRQLWDAGLAHRDIKPANLLVRHGHVQLLDVAFGAVRPTPWRQAVDLANMMLTLALQSTPEAVYERALRQFSAEDIAEAFAASRTVTIPAQLRARLRADGRDLVDRFRSLAPPRPPIAIQRWSLRRVGLTAGLLAGVAAAVALLLIDLRLAGLL